MKNKQRKNREDHMDRGIRDLVKGPFVKFRTKTMTRSGYILTDVGETLSVWSNGKLMKIRKDQILFREE